MRSMDGVGMTPPKVLGHAVTLVIGHDQQDVGRTFGRHHGRWPIRFGLFGIQIDRSAKRRGRRRKYLPSIVVVASGEPGVPVVCCWPYAAEMPAIIIPANDNPSQIFLSVRMT